jgi:glycosyltransferase involved in cell wall biosynthesis
MHRFLRSASAAGRRREIQGDRLDPLEFTMTRRCIRDRTRGGGMNPASRHLAMGLMFYPRGGSAQVARYLTRALERRGWGVTLVTGSLGEAGEQSHAETFYDGIDVVPVDFTPALRSFESGGDPMKADPPFHPSFELRAGVPDRIFTSVSPELAQRQDTAWSAAFERAGMADVDVAHLHHLTPMQVALHRVAPEIPLVTHLHGTELKMLEQIEVLGRDVGAPEFAHAGLWRERMKEAARRSQRMVTISDQDTRIADGLLGIDPGIVCQIPNGVDMTVFTRSNLDARRRRAFWKRCLVEEPLGWDASGSPGTIRYDERDLDAFGAADGSLANPVLLFVGRFLGFKRVPLLVRAYARAREHFATNTPLVVWGGSPGEWEGDHPAEVAATLGVKDVFFSGWRPHDDTAMALACSDVMVAPSVGEPFGQVYLEAMACGLPVIATRSGGPLTFINASPEDPDGWLVEPDSEQALADAMIEAINDAGERSRRGERAHATVRRSYSWDAIAERFIAVYREAMAG